jgi:hypothetical protein
MPIYVVCPGCKTRFQVSDRFAGRTGPCPKCKTPITIPTPEKNQKPEVKIHVPEEFSSGGRSTTGKLVLKPIPRRYARWDPVAAVGIAAAGLGVMLITALLGWVGVFHSWIAQAIGLAVISPPLVVAGYLALYDEESEPYRGWSLYLRATVCGWAFASLWALYGYVGPRVLTGEVWNWLFLAPPFLVLGGLASFACLDLDWANGMFLYAFYAVVTIILRWLAGLGWIWMDNPLPM